jgi:uncharacterized protein (TIGR03118 family)
MDRCTSVRMFVAVAASGLLISSIAAAQQRIPSLGGLSQGQSQGLTRPNQSLGGQIQGLTGQNRGLGGLSQSQGPGQVQAQVLAQGCLIQSQSQGQTTTFAETDLVANTSPLIINGISHTPQRSDPNLVNPWGLTASPTSPFWVADNGAGVSTLYAVKETTLGPPNTRVVSIPSATDPLGDGTGTPTGVVFNIAPASPPAFQITGVTTASPHVTNKQPSNFIFATEDGLIVGWSNNAQGVNPPGFDPAKAGNYGIIAVKNTDNPVVGSGAVYKGLAIATDSTGKTLLYAANFRAGTVEVYDTSFTRVTSPGAFTDLNLPSGYAPFNIVPVGNRLIVTYAVQDAAKHDDVAGLGHGIVNSFDLSGGSLQRLVQFGCLNSPWGVALAPNNFGPLAGALLIGNFGDGRIGAYNSTNGQLIDLMRDHQGNFLAIDGLWSLRVGSGATGTNNNFGPDAVYFTAGPNDEKDGLFGALKPN